MTATTISEIYDAQCRAWSTFQRRTIKLAALAHPNTGGNEMLIHNWGNEEARRIMRDSWRRWETYKAGYQRKMAAAHHREHERENRVGAYLWCPACTAVRKLTATAA